MFDLSKWSRGCVNHCATNSEVLRGASRWVDRGVLLFWGCPSFHKLIACAPKFKREADARCRNRVARRKDKRALVTERHILAAPGSSEERLPFLCWRHYQGSGSEERCSQMDINEFKNNFHAIWQPYGHKLLTGHCMGACCARAFEFLFFSHRPSLPFGLRLIRGEPQFWNSIVSAYQSNPQVRILSESLVTRRS